MFHWFFWKITVFSLGCEVNIFRNILRSNEFTKQDPLSCTNPKQPSVEQSNSAEKGWRRYLSLHVITLNFSQRTLGISAPLLQEIWKTSSPMNIYLATLWLGFLLSLQIRDKGLDPLKLRWTLKVFSLNDSEGSCCILCTALSPSCATRALPGCSL